MTPPDFQQNYFQLFDLAPDFCLDEHRLGERFRQLQAELHPDRYAGAPEQEQRLAVQYSSLVNEAYATLREPLPRALYLLQLAGLDQEQIARQQIDGGFLIVQMELREKLESMQELVDPEPVLDHLLAEISADTGELQDAFQRAYRDADMDEAAAACVKMQYLDKLRAEAEQLEADIMDNAG